MNSLEGIRVGVVGLGYVGLPLALAVSRRFVATVGFDVNEHKVASIKRGEDPTSEGLEEQIREGSLMVTTDAKDLASCSVILVAVPTPVDGNNKPDLTPLRLACETVGAVMKPGTTIVFESTVYPGLTEEVCGPWLEKASGLRQGVDFKLGYSPERINPGDKQHTIERIIKVVAGQDQETLDLVAAVYGAFVEAGVFRAKSIKVAEAAKVIENAQRDINIAFMNELCIIFDRIGIATQDVLAAAATKWNFLKFTPGLVGGHCIGVDPYYLTTKAEELGYHPQVILAGRRINDDMGRYVAHRFMKCLSRRGIASNRARIGVLGITFKENVADLRNSRVPDIVAELRDFGVEPLVFDPLVRSEDSIHEYGISFSALAEFSKLDGLILAVPHGSILAEGVEGLVSRLRPGGIFFDLKGSLSDRISSFDVEYWSL